MEIIRSVFIQIVKSHIGCPNKSARFNFQCCQPNRTTMAHTLNLALLLGHPIKYLFLYENFFQFILIIIFLFLPFFSFPFLRLYVILYCSKIFLAVPSPSDVRNITNTFTVTHNTHTFCCSTNCHLAILLTEYLCTFIISLKHSLLVLSLSCHPLLAPTPSHQITF